MRKLHLLLILTFFFSISSFAQITIKGQVMDGTGASLTGVSVQIKGSTNEIVTNLDGKYTIVSSISNPKVVFRLDGYSNVEGAPNNGVLNITMLKNKIEFSDLSLEELMKMTIEVAGKTQQSIVDVPASVVVLSRKEIELYGYRSLEEIISNIPGLYSLGDAYWEGATNFGIRGFSSPGANTNMMILVNGVNQMNDFSNSFSTDRIAIPVEAIDRIEVIRGPNSVIYGSSAFMCLINIITDSDKEESQVSTSVGTNDLLSSFVRVASENVVFNAGVSTASGVNVPYSEMQSDPTKISKWGLPINATTENQYWKKKKYFSVSANKGGFRFNVSYLNHNLGVTGSTPSANTEQGYDGTINEMNVFGEYKKSFGDKLTVTVKGLYHNYEMKGFAHLKYADSYSLHLIHSNAAEAEVNVQYKPTDKLDILLGVNNRAVFDAGMFIDFVTFPKSFQDLEYYVDKDQPLKVNSSFLQVNYALSDKIKLTAGARVEKANTYKVGGMHGEARTASGADTTQLFEFGEVDQSKMQFIPRAACIFKINDNNVVKLMYAMANKRASLLENVDLSGRGVYNLDFAKMQTIELNYLASLNNMFNVNVSLFQNNVDNLIMRTVNVQSDGSFAVSASNAGDLQTRGAELTLIAKPSDHLSIELSQSYQSTENNTPGYENAPIAYSPDYLAYFKAGYRLDNGLSIGLNARYISKINSGWDVEDKVAYGKTVPEYLTLGLNIRMDNIAETGFYASVKGSNLLNSEIRYPTTGSSDWTDLGKLDFGRRFFMTLGYRFE